ncbi:hypothetical protein MNBD_GAMMA26-2639 [hydrothermal vent metagenome]|uniref:Uncharacterized protein n=1 Tax=hydrothermal vent metagenome TaxID=652676 RepID=A0A3B1AN30_9ZZZZ
MHHIKNWSIPTALSPPEPQQLHLWQIDLATGSRDLHTLLSTDEQERAQRYLSDQDRNRFIRTRSAVRTILGNYLAVPPQDLEFVYGLHGKPFICFPASVLAFNLSHTGNLALLAVSRETAIGIDLEQLREKPNTLAIANRVFAPPIQEELAGYKGDQLTQAFFHYWTALEARTKALGNGIFSNRCGTRDAALEIQHFSPGEGLIAAIAMEQTPPFDAWETYQ